MNSFKISNISNHYEYDYVMCQEEQIWKMSSLHILKFDALMSCESNEHVDLCMIIMLFLLCPFFIYKTLESGSSRSSMPVEQSVVWKWISLGVQWESSQACMWQLLTMLLISIWSLTILLSLPNNMTQRKFMTKPAEWIFPTSSIN